MVLVGPTFPRQAQTLLKRLFKTLMPVLLVLLRIARWKAVSRLTTTTALALLETLFLIQSAFRQRCNKHGRRSSHASWRVRIRFRGKFRSWRTRLGLLISQPGYVINRTLSIEKSAHHNNSCAAAAYLRGTSYKHLACPSFHCQIRSANRWEHSRN